MTNTICITYYQAPIGKLILGSAGNRLCLCDWDQKDRHIAIERRLCTILDADYKEAESDVNLETIAQLNEYFAGNRIEFSISVKFVGTEFQCRVWSELVKIPFGSTISYAEQAQRIGNPKAVRAVAKANSANPISIIVPCHRVIGSNLKLTGYAGGLQVKQWLLDHEAGVRGKSLFDPLINQF